MTKNNEISKIVYDEEIKRLALKYAERVIERHNNLDKVMLETDQAASIEFSGLRQLVIDLHRLYKWISYSHYKTHIKINCIWIIISIYNMINFENLLKL